MSSNLYPSFQSDHKLVEWLSYPEYDPEVFGFEGGYDSNGEKLFVALGSAKNEIIPGKFVPSHKTCYVSYGGEEINCKKFHFLRKPTSTEYVWMKSKFGEIPTGAIEAGITSCSEKYFIGRVHHQNSLCLGKVHSSNYACFIPYSGEEHKYFEYEVLCVKYINYPI